MMDLAFLDNLGCQARGTQSFPGLVSPPSRRSLTTHRAPWLRRSAATGVSPGEGPTSLQITEDGGEVRNRTDNQDLLRAIVNSNVFTEFATAFTRATGLPVALHPVESFQLSFHHCRTQGPFCALMAGQNRTCGACLRSQSKVTEIAVEKPHTTVCYAGLCEAAVPLRLGSRLIGFLRTGQVFQRKPGEPEFQRIVKLLESWGMKLEPNVLREAYFKTAVVSREQQAAALKLLTIFADHLAIVGNQIVIQSDNSEPPMITKAKNFIREHHTEDLSLPQVAQFANASPFHFCKLFKRSTGLTFTKFLSRVRIESSKNLLINPQLRVSEVAYEVGFQSLTHFNRVFQKLLGQSPTEYRLKMQNREKAA